MKCFDCEAYTAEEYLAMGATDVFTFGPILVTNGQPGPQMSNTKYYHFKEPRCALGMVEPGHYIILTVKGRSDDSAGCYFSWLSDRMIDLGVQEALNFLRSGIDFRHVLMHFLHGKFLVDPAAFLLFIRNAKACGKADHAKDQYDYDSDFNPTHVPLLLTILCILCALLFEENSHVISHLCPHLLKCAGVKLGNPGYGNVKDVADFL